MKTVCKADIVLCSATQPDFENLPFGYGIRFGMKRRELVPDFRKYFTALRRTEIVSIYRHKMSCAELGEFACKRAEENKTVLVIMNTKAAAKALYKELLERGKEVMLLTTRLCRAHRADVLKKIEAAEGKEFICVSTQLIEAGIDIDMDCVIRSFAGLDSLAQAAGRCNRNGKKGIKKVYFVSVDFENLSRLPQIKNAQAASENVLGHIADEEGIELISPEITEKYCRAYRNELGKKELKYPVDLRGEGIQESSLCDLLISGLCTKKLPNLAFKQAFKTAGKKFNVISAETKSVIVPYGDGADIIKKLQSNSDIAEGRKLLKAAQAYTVNVFGYEFEAMQNNNGLTYIDSVGAYAADSAFYDKETGLHTDGFPNTVY